MEITPEQFAKIEHCLPTQRGNVSLSNVQVVNAILYVAEHGCKWRGLPKRFGNWHTIYTRMNRWTKSGVLDRMFEELQKAQVVRIKIEAVSLDSTSIKVHPDGTGALKKGSSPICVRQRVSARAPLLPWWYQASRRQEGDRGPGASYYPAGRLGWI